MFTVLFLGAPSNKRSQGTSQKKNPITKPGKKSLPLFVNATRSQSLFKAHQLSVTYHPASFIIKVLKRKGLHPSHADITYPHFFLLQCKIQTQKALPASWVCAFLYFHSEAILLLFVLQVNNR